MIAWVFALGFVILLIDRFTFRFFSRIDLGELLKLVFWVLIIIVAISIYQNK